MFLPLETDHFGGDCFQDIKLPVDGPEEFVEMLRDQLLDFFLSHELEGAPLHIEGVGELRKLVLGDSVATGGCPPGTFGKIKDPIIHFVLCGGLGLLASR